MFDFEKPGRSTFSSLRKEHGTMDAAFTFYQALRDRWEDRVEITGSDADALLHLLRTHPRWSEKVTMPVVGFVVDRVGDEGSHYTRAFHWLDAEGEKHSFSYVKCIHNVFGGVEWRNASRRKRRRTKGTNKEKNK